MDNKLSGWPPVQPKTAATPTRQAAGRLPWEMPLAPPEPDKPGRRGRSAGLMLAVALVGSTFGAAGTYLALGTGEEQAAPEVASAVKIGTPETRLPGAADEAEAVATALLPSIVKIQAQGAGTSGTGSGVIYSSDGYIITNDHVVGGATTLTVQLHTGEVVPGQIVGSAAPLVDIAVLRIDREGLKAAKFGSSSELKVGELAVAIGNPLGLEASVSAGVISGLHRNGSVGGERFIDSIQTDAPLQPGNSGGALANADAEVIGINTLVISQRNIGTGLGLAISSETVKVVAEQIIDTGSAELAFLGISGGNAETGRGAVVHSVTPGGPAEQSGLRPGDVVISLDGDRTDTMDGLISGLLRKEVGDEVAIEIVREGSRRTVGVTLQARED